MFDGNDSLQQPSTRIAVDEASQTGEARRAAGALADKLGFNETDRGKVSIVVSEMATNLARHGSGGEILLRPLVCGEVIGLEVLALDRGPGIEDIGRCLQDGYSTRGTAGTGLGAIRRLSDLFEIHSIVGKGTAVLAQLWSGRKPAAAGPGMDWGVVCLPLNGDPACGDGWAIRHQQAGPLILMVDGLGHGLLAAEAAREAIRLFHSTVAAGPVAMLEAQHQALRKTRGAAMAVLQMDRPREVARFAGVGNISTVILDDQGVRQSTFSYNGIVGFDVRKLQEFEYRWGREIVVLHSDGLTTSWDLDRYPGLRARHPSLIAGVLYRDFARGTDDLTVMVGRSRT